MTARVRGVISSTFDAGGHRPEVGLEAPDLGRVLLGEPGSGRRVLASAHLASVAGIMPLVERLTCIRRAGLERR